MRSEFEKLPEIKELLFGIKFSAESNSYETNDFVLYGACGFINGAWYAFQEQQKKIDQHNQKLKVFIDELRKTHNDDKENKIDYWRGFSECADSSAKVFLRDVGFIE